ncbi:uncharacterized protein [Apostichopus japonicus]|uniref:uncharacterized protein n=1 Tax=Stichopus japonicus TaxID=307972 RepID=UPI003AB6E913
MQDQLRLYPDFMLAKFEAERLIQGLPSCVPLDHKNDPERMLLIPSGYFGIINLPRVEQYTTPAAFEKHQQDDTTSTWSDIQGQHSQQTTTTRCEGKVTLTVVGRL